MILAAQFVLNYADLAVVLAVLIAGYAGLYLLLSQRLQREIDRLHGEWSEQISLLMVSERLKGPDAAPVIKPSPIPAIQPKPAAATPPVVPTPKPEITPETLLVIAAAVTAYLGKKVRIRSAKELYLHESFNTWSQQGRAVVQASHNVAQRVH